MDFSLSDNSREVLERVSDFCEREVLPRNREMIQAFKVEANFDPALLTPLRARARSLGLWNFAMTELDDGVAGYPLSNLDYAPVAEYLGRILWSSKVFNCQWPDVPNMVALQQCATPEQKAVWLRPLLDGDCHSAFAMTEPEVASSDATNIATRIERDGDCYVVSGTKWYISGSAHPQCRFYMVLGISNPEASANRRHSVVMVPRNAEGVTIGPRSTFFGFTEPAGPAHALRFDNVRVPVGNRIGGEGDGFRVAQARLAPARLHHCMRAVGQCELLIELMLQRAAERRTFGRAVIDYDTLQGWIALSRVQVEQIRLLTWKTAWLVDTRGSQGAFRDLAILKVAVVQAYRAIADRAVQVFGAMGGNDISPVSESYAWSRAFAIADGPDEVHLRTIFNREAIPASTIANSPYMPGPDLLFRTSAGGGIPE
ncbi:MAG: acyl-CoA dehydrogenase family protein [Pseudomonadales bacterium]|nr:acyl-CoA dehydrogenase family protein [Pseudomonadales bacterium]